MRHAPSIVVPLVREVPEAILKRLPAPKRWSAHEHACHLAHAQGVRAQPRALLADIPGLTVVPVPEAEVCCGSAGIFNLTQPAMATELGQRKAAQLSSVTPDVVVTSNPGCILQIQSAAREQQHTFKVLHLVELLDASISGRAL